MFGVVHMGDDGVHQWVDEFVDQWQSGVREFRFQTSGSTGGPREILLSRDLLELSARKTLAALPLMNCKQAILCIDPRFIGGAMLVVRSILAGWTLQQLNPGMNPQVAGLEPGFISLIPSQLQTLADDEANWRWLNQCSCILLGGTRVNRYQESLARALDCPVYHSYGMTETVSHVALKRLNGSSPDPYFVAMPNITISSDEQGLITVEGDITNNRPLKTSDIGIVHKDGFEVLGRNDFVINSGGIKIHPEVVELAIENLLPSPGPEFIVVGIPDELYGEKAVLVTEEGSEFNLKEIRESIALNKYHLPKEIIEIPRFIRTPNGKVNRLATIKTLNV